jgi:hypothetical protein
LNDSSYPIHLEADIRTDIEIAQARCNHVIINLVGSNERIRLYFLKPGCTRWSMIRIGEKDYDGLYHDLSSFGVDFSEWKAVSLHITRAENKFLLQVSVDSESVFRDDFSTQLGDILGVEFTFSGCGKFKNPELNDRPIR